MIAGSLDVQMRGDITQLAADMQDAKRTTNDTMSEIGRIIGEGMRRAWEEAKTAWDSFKEWIKTQTVIFGVALAAGVSAAVLGAVYAAFKAASFGIGLLTGESYKSENIDRLTALNKEVKTLQENLPLTADGASALNEALKTLGTDSEGYVATLHKAEAAARSNTAELDRLGVKYKDANGNLLTTRERLESAAAVLATYKEGWDRQQAALAIGMGSEKQIQQALAVTAEKVAVAQDRLRDYGLVIGDETQTAVRQYEDAMRDFRRETELTSDGFTKAIADNIMPMLTMFAEFFREGFPTVVSIFRYSMATVTSLILGLKTSFFIVAETMLGSVHAIGLSLRGLAEASVKLLKGDFSGAKDALLGGWNEAKTRLGQIGENIVEQARRNAAAMRLAWGFDNFNVSNPTERGRGGKPWTPAPTPEEIKATKEQTSEFEKLMKAIAEKTAVMQAEISGQEKLSDAEQFALKTMVNLRDGVLQLTEAERQRLAVALEVMLQTDKEIKQLAIKKTALEAYVKAMQMEEELAAEIAKIMENRSPITGEVLAGRAQNDLVEGIERETRALAMSSEQREIATALRALEASGLNRLGTEYERLALRIIAAIKEKHAIQEMLEAQKTAAKEVNEFWNEAFRNMQRAASDFLFDTMQGKFDDFGSRFKTMLDRMVADWLAAQLLMQSKNILFGKDFGSPGVGIGGLIGQGLDMLGFGSGRAPVGDAALSDAFRADLWSGSYATGTDYVPRTGMYQLHRGEAVLTEEQNARGGRGQITQIFNISTPDTNGVRLSKRQVMGEFAAAMG